MVAATLQAKPIHEDTYDPEVFGPITESFGWQQMGMKVSDLLSKCICFVREHFTECEVQQSKNDWVWQSAVMRQHRDTCLLKWIQDV